MQETVTKNEIAGAAILMLQDEGKLKVADPVASYLPEFVNLKTPLGPTGESHDHAAAHTYLRPRRAGSPRPAPDDLSAIGES